jgi:hypothetical protein
VRLGCNTTALRVHLRGFSGMDDVVDEGHAGACQSVFAPGP